MYEKAFTERCFLPSIFQKNLFQTVSPVASLYVGDHKDFVQEERLALQYSTMCLATFVVVDVFICLDTQTWEVLAVSERLPF